MAKVRDALKEAARCSSTPSKLRASAMTSNNTCHVASSGTYRPALRSFIFPPKQTHPPSKQKTIFPHPNRPTSLLPLQNMNVEMETDIPLPEELEWLESNSLLPEDDPDFYPPYEEEDLPEPSTKTPGNFPFQSLSPPPPSSFFSSYFIDPSHSYLSDPTVAVNQASKKRPWSEKEGVSDEKRSRKSPETEADEDWLRYSPPPRAPAPDPVMDAAPVDDVQAPAAIDEKVLSRFASEIDGECISVTDPGGDRVYAKMSRWVMESDVKRLRIERPVNGILVLIS